MSDQAGGAGGKTIGTTSGPDAAAERLALSRDLHDAMIQPYVGLKLALEALHREALAADSALAGRVAELVAMADLTLADLRQYAAGLSGVGPLRGEFLLAALNRQGERLRRYFGLEVRLDCGLLGQLEGPQAADLFQIASEGLSNVLRHAGAKRAQVELVCENRMFRLRIINDREGGQRVAPAFIPRSIEARARALGGEMRVEQDDAKTVVQVLIPQGGDSNE